MITSFIISLRALVVFTVLTGLLYPLSLTGLSGLLFGRQSQGSLVMADGVPVGSELLAQKFSSDRYFWPRPSASDYGTVPSGASNQGFTSRKLLDAVRLRQEALGAGAPPDLVYASGSGLDPHLSPDAAEFQVVRVAQARGMPEGKVRETVSRILEPSQYGIFGQPRINVLLLNLALDQAGQP